MEFSKASEVEANRHVHALFFAMTKEPLNGIRNLHPAYNTLTIDFDPLTIKPRDLEFKVQSLLEKTVHSSPSNALVKIPVSYGKESGPDLAEVSHLTGLSVSEVVSRHSKAEYTVAFLGFSPGFPYLLGLPRELSVPRLETPRLRVAAGSVAIAGEQAGIYPEFSPGGWRILGRTDVKLFDLQRDPSVLLSPGDRVCFVPVGALP